MLEYNKKNLNELQPVKTFSTIEFAAVFCDLLNKFVLLLNL